MDLEKCEFRLALTRPDEDAAIGCFRYCGLNGDSRHCGNRSAIVASTALAIDPDEGRLPMHASGMGRLGRESVVAVARPPARRSQVVWRTSSAWDAGELAASPGAAATSRESSGCSVEDGGSMAGCFAVVSLLVRGTTGAAADAGQLDRCRRYGRNLSRQPSLPIRLIADQCPAAAECDKDDDVRPKHGIATTASSWRANPFARIKLSRRRNPLRNQKQNMQKNLHSNVVRELTWQIPDIRAFVDIGSRCCICISNSPGQKMAIRRKMSATLSLGRRH